MGLEDFEKELAASRSARSERKRDRSRDREKHHKHHPDYHHHHSSAKHSHRSRDERKPGDRHSHRRSNKHRDHDDDYEAGRRARKRQRSASPGIERSNADDDMGFDEKEIESAPPGEDVQDEAIAAQQQLDEKRDAWMVAPSALDIDYVSRKRKASPPSRYRSAQEPHDMQVQQAGLQGHLTGLDHQEDADDVQSGPAQHEITYTIGDIGSSWRMTKLKGVYRKAKESGRAVKEVAEETYGSLRDFDDAREEEIEIDRRKRYGNGYVGKDKPNGDLYEERKRQSRAQESRAKSPKDRSSRYDEDGPRQGKILPDEQPTAHTRLMDQSALNKLKAQMMKAQLKKAPNAAELEAEYNLALSQAANRREPEVIVLGAEHSRQLAGTRDGEIRRIDNKRGRERGIVEENEDMSIDDMVRQERRTKGMGEGRAFAERIAKDAKFDDDLEYMDENAEKLSKRVQRSDVNLRNTAISDFHKMNRILDTCPLCYHEEANPPKPPTAPVISLATRVYMTLPTDPEISEGGACIIPIQHRLNLLECDDDEWEEIRNFMKSLTRMYDDQGRDVVFYENAAHTQRKRHASLEAVPLPKELGETCPAFFREAILSADEEWSQHKKIIDTGKKAREGLGKQAFRKTLVKEMPYFHIWFDLNGGLGHVIEDSNRWPRGDLFAREVLGGMLDRAPDVIKRQGRWHRSDGRVDGFRQRWRPFDWTRVLIDSAAS